MSHVTNCILSFGILEEERARLDDVNRALAEQGCAGTFVEGQHGGTKAMERPTFVAAFNYLSLDEFLVAMRRIEWRDAPLVQLHVCEQDDETYAERFAGPVDGLALEEAKSILSTLTDRQKVALDLVFQADGHFPRFKTHTASWANADMVLRSISLLAARADGRSEQRIWKEAFGLDEDELHEVLERGFEWKRQSGVQASESDAQGHPDHQAKPRGE